MATLDSITIAPAEIARILDELRIKRFYGPVVIIDTIDCWTVRDIDKQKLAEVKKETEAADG
jgi:hypothetical protein